MALQPTATFRSQRSAACRELLRLHWGLIIRSLLQAALCVVWGPTATAVYVTVWGPTQLRMLQLRLSRREPQPLVPGT